MVTPAFYLLVLLLAAHRTALGFNFDQLFNLTGVFEKCTASNVLNASAPCVCLNTMPASPSDSDQRRQVTAQSCFGCRTRAMCSATSCKNLATCSSELGCTRLCLCVCPNRTTSFGGRVYIPCEEWCASRSFCPSAVCTTNYSFKLSTTGVTVAVSIIAVCFVIRAFQKLRRKRIVTRGPSQPAEEVTIPRASMENLTMPAMSQEPPYQPMPTPGHSTAAPAYSIVPAPSATDPAGDMTSQIDAPPDYDTVMSQIDRTPPPKYS